MAALVKVKNRYSRGALDFEPPFYFKKDNVYPDLVELIRQQAELRTEQLIKLEARVNETIISSGNLTSAVANLRIQRNVLWFTVFAAVLTLFSILRGQPILNEIKEQLSSLVQIIETLL